MVPGIAGCLLWGALAVPAAAEPFIEQVVPPIVARGQTIRIRLRGNDLDRPEALWTSLPPGSVRSAPVGGLADGAEFDVTIDPQSPLGIFGLRAATAKGLSNVHLFVVDDLPIMAAEGLSTEQSLSLPVAVWGTCRPTVVERFVIQVAAGERVTFETIGSRLGKDFDPLLVLRDSAGRRVAWHDNDGGLCFDGRMEHEFAAAGEYTCAARGIYTVELSDARYKGADNWSYVLKLGHFPVARVAVPSSIRPGQSAELTFPQAPGATLSISPPADGLPLAPRAEPWQRAWFQEVRLPGDNAAAWLPLAAVDLDNHVEVEPNDTPEQASPVAAPGAWHGCLQSPGDEDWFTFELQQGQSIDVRGVSWPLGSPVDLELTLTSAMGQEYARIDDQQQEEASFRFGAPQPGTYRLRVRDMAHDGGAAFAYRIEVHPAGSRLDVAAEAPGLCVPQGNWQPIPLRITRTDYNGPIDLALSGATTGLTLEPTRVPEGATEFVTRLKADGSAPIGVHTIQILASGVAPDPPPVADPAVAPTPPPALPPTVLVRTQPLVDRQLMNVDRIIYALREDQRRLPPSLTDRFAVQVTPPVPFDVELAQGVATLARFQTVGLPLRTTRTVGFAGPIAFVARGGQLGEEAELRVQVFARIPPATPEAADLTAMFHSRNLVNIKKDLVYLDATAEHDGRVTTLIRTFDLDVKPAFDVTVEPMTMQTLAPGETGRARLHVARLPTFNGAVEIVPQQVARLRFPDRVTVPAGESSVEIEFQAAADCPLQQFNIRLPCEAQVDEYREDIPGPTIQIEVKKPM